jgi:endo-1,4-beta-D-glucanase Y
MNKTKWPKGKIFFLFCILGVYVAVAAILGYAVSKGYIERSPPMINFQTGDDSEVVISESRSVAGLEAAQLFVERNLVKSNGHVDLYIASDSDFADNNTNSEAISYYLLWAAQEKDKRKFDKVLTFMEDKMLHPRFGYMMWRLNDADVPEGDGSNIATDADLRAIKALLIAEKQWKDDRYTKDINRLAMGLEKLGITEDKYLAPYGGVSGQTSTWTAKEVWLSYADFTVFDELEKRRGGVWKEVNANMREAVLDAQIHNGLYNSMLTEDREYGNGLDAGGYSINSMWIMVRNAESGDPVLMESANKSLQFYKDKYMIDAEVYAQYGSSGDALSPTGTPWVYALVGRAAVALGDKEFSEQMIAKLLEYQIVNEKSRLHGAFPEGPEDSMRVGQFTMQESILTLQDFNNKDW